jgi:hypothetical protein
MKAKKMFALLLFTILVIGGLSLVGLAFDEPEPGSEEFYSHQEDERDDPLLVVVAIIGMASVATGAYGFYKQLN